MQCFAQTGVFSCGSRAEVTATPRTRVAYQGYPQIVERRASPRTYPMFHRRMRIKAHATAPLSAAPESSFASTAMPPFHLAFPVADLDQTKAFYGSLLGCPEGRSAAKWVDYKLFGHQIVCHHVKGYNASATANAVDGDPVPVPHFGLALSVPQFKELAERVEKANVQFVIQPHLRFQGEPGEQWTMFFKDPSGNALEFKAMTNPENLFAKYYVS